MASRDGKNNMKVVKSILPQAVTGNVTGSAVDTLGFEKVTFVFSAAAVTAGTVKLTECATSGGTYTDVADGDVIGTQDAAIVASDVITIGYIGGLRYLKPVFTHSANGTLTADAILEDALLAKTGAN